MKTLTKKTHIAEVREANLKGIQQVCHLLQWTEQDYCEFQFQQYCLFVDTKYSNFPDIIANRVLYSPLFRGFFNNEAYKRDEVEFLPFAEDLIEPIWTVAEGGEIEIIKPIDVEDLVTEWMLIHDYKRLLNDEAFIAGFQQLLTIMKLR